MKQLNTLNYRNSQVLNRLQIEYLYHPNHDENSHGEDVIQGLTQTPKTLPPKYFYDDVGSQLFEQICDLSEYYVTRTEAAILKHYASEIAANTGSCELVELGSGSSTKTRFLLDAYQQLKLPLRYLPIDVSAGILETSATQLIADYPMLEIQAYVSTYELALSHLKPRHLPKRCISFLGSTLGNLNAAECGVFFSQVADALQEGDYFLLGVDLQKPVEVLEAAYNDSQGVTAAFNLNMLAHLNHRFQGDFNLAQFEHWSFYNRTLNQIEMHLRSLTQQRVRLKTLNLELDLAERETIFTEISRKFDVNSVKADLQQWGLQTVQVWTDEKGWFGLILSQKLG